MDGELMTRNEVEIFEHVDKVNSLMRNGGLLLVTGDEKKPNAMTIGWGFLGTMWRKPVFVVAVRLTRYTYELIENSDSFTVCLPAKGMEEALTLCGTKSGRDMDKLDTLGFNVKKGKTVNAPYIVECPVHYECEIIYKDQVRKGELKQEVEEDAYPNENWHVLYYGQVKGAYALHDAKVKLP
jgi:flavin reductase (DIM6/NTAB) family NADH-FMN oxidoreductase RutF